MFFLRSNFSTRTKQLIVWSVRNNQVKKIVLGKRSFSWYLQECSAKFKNLRFRSSGKDYGYNYDVLDEIFWFKKIMIFLDQHGCHGFYRFSLGESPTSDVTKGNIIQVFYTSEVFFQLNGPQAKPRTTLENRDLQSSLFCGHCKQQLPETSTRFVTVLLVSIHFLRTQFPLHIFISFSCSQP